MKLEITSIGEFKDAICKLIIKFINNGPYIEEFGFAYTEQMDYILIGGKIIINDKIYNIDINHKIIIIFIHTCIVKQIY